MNENDKALAKRLGDEAKTMDWNSFSSSVSGDVAIVKTEIRDLRSEYKIEIQSLKNDLVLNKQVSDWLILFFLACIPFILERIYRFLKK